MSPILALTIWPEWAWAICHLDKRVENRGERFARQIDKRVGDGRLAIHSGVRRPADFAAVAAMSGMPYDVLDYDDVDLEDAVGPVWQFGATGGTGGVLIEDARLTRGAIVALAKIGDVLLPGAQAPWKLTFSAALSLSPVLILPDPIPCKGQQGLWTPPPDIQERLCAALEK